MKLSPKQFAGSKPQPFVYKRLLRLLNEPKLHAYIVSQSQQNKKAECISRVNKQNRCNQTLPTYLQQLPGAGIPLLKKLVKHLTPL